MIYKVIVGETASLAKDVWYLEARSLLDAVKKAEKKKRSPGSEWQRGWSITSAEQIGELER